MTSIPQPNNQSTPQNPVGRFMVAVGGVIELQKSGKILMIQRADDQDWRPGEWEIDYGRIDQFEDPVDGLRRELQEEVGITQIEVLQLLTVWHIYRGPKAAENDLIGITYACRVDNDAITLSHEHQGFRWVTPEEGLVLTQTEGIRRDLHHYIAWRKTQQ